MAKLQLQGKHSKLESLEIEGLYIYCAIVGLNSENMELKEKLLELKDVTIHEVTRVLGLMRAHSVQLRVCPKILRCLLVID